MTLPTRLKELIPLDKSWLIRMGMLDLHAGEQQRSVDFLRVHKRNLGDDLLALLDLLESWGTSSVLRVGESGTLYRFVRYYCWLTRDTRAIETTGTLKDRQLYNNSDVLQMNLDQLLQLDGGTSQWASAAVLFGAISVSPKEKVPYKLQTTLDALNHWRESQAASTSWKQKIDQTILRQAEAYYNWLQVGTMHFTPEQAEDFLFACAFGLMTPEEGERRWPQLRNHESDRILAMESLLGATLIDSPDHRVVQALAMRFPERLVSEQSRKAVGKSWPKFWDFLKATEVDA